MSVKSIKARIEKQKARVRAIQAEHRALNEKNAALVAEITIKTAEYLKAEERLKSLYEELSEGEGK